MRQIKDSFRSNKKKHVFLGQPQVQQVPNIWLCMILQPYETAVSTSPMPVAYTFVFNDSPMSFTEVNLP